MARTRIFSRLLNRAQARFRQARPASVLIMVIALLVLLALIGTAAISTARIDRSSSRQNVANTQIDLLVEGTKNLVVAAITGDLYSHGVYRDAFKVGTTYDHWDSPATDPNSANSDINDPNGATPTKSNDAWLGSRLPELSMKGDPMWRYLSYPLIRNAAGGYSVNSPDQPGTFTLNLPKRGYIPSVYRLGSTDYPGFQEVDPLTGNTSGAVFMAGDADGDGIPDSLLFRLPVGTIAGTTYYAGYRVIDHNSAINVNTAGLRDMDFADANTAVPNDGFFPGNIALGEFLKDYPQSLPSSPKLDNSLSKEYRALLDRRFRGASFPDGVASGAGTPLDDQNKAPAVQFRYRTLADAMHMGLGRRLDFPGYVVKGTFYGGGTRPYTYGDQFALSNRFCLGTTSVSISAIETDLFTSAAAVRNTPYLAGDSVRWFNDNFNFNDPKYRPPVRPFFVTHNPVSNVSPARLDSGYHAKVSINTAPVAELYRGYLELMSLGDAKTKTSPIGRDVNEAANNDGLSFKQSQADPTDGSEFTQAGANILPGKFENVPKLHIGRMFRSSMRSKNSPVLSSLQMVQLRAAIASANTMAMRSGSDAPYVNKVQLVDATGTPQYDAQVYGYARQPFITEVFASTDINKVVPGADPQDPRLPFKDMVNKNGFVAVELHNPYDKDIPLDGWVVASMDRAKAPTMTLTPLSAATELGGKVVPAGGYVVLTNFKAASTDDFSAQYWPFASIKPTDDKLIYVNNLSKALPHAQAEELELVILRPGAAAGGALEEMVPVDSYDFTGLILPATAPAKAEAWHYSRANLKTAPGKAWAFVYPGRYNSADTAKRHQGTQQETWDPTPGGPPPPAAPGAAVGAPPPGGGGPGGGGAGEPEPWAPGGVAANPSILLGLPDPTSTRNPTGAEPKDPKDPKDFQIQLAVKDSPGPDPLGTASARFPFGLFARVGDILQVPYIGAYRINATGNAANIIELNSITMDSIFAEDTDGADDLVEDIGRFSPITSRPDLALGDPSVKVNDFEQGGTYDVTQNQLWHYRWSMRLFDIFTTISNPHDDYLPNVDTGTPVVNGYKVTDPAQANKEVELAAPVEGLININTASWKVLSALPFTPPAAGQAVAFNENVAKSIVQYRDYDDGSGKPHGPFTSLFELSRVPIYDFTKPNAKPVGFFQDVWALADGDLHDADDDDGDFSPAGKGNVDGVLGDFKEKHLSLNRISNLITLRSDCFTCYVLVQGWRDAGGPNATLVVQRRIAFIVDRSMITPTDRRPNVLNIPSVGN